MMNRRLKSIPKNGVNSHKNLDNYEIMNETVDAATRSSINIAEQKLDICLIGYTFFLITMEHVYLKEVNHCFAKRVCSVRIMPF